MYKYYRSFRIVILSFLSYTMLNFSTHSILEFSDEQQSFWIIFALSGDEKTRIK